LFLVIEISHLLFSILPAVEFCFLVINPIIPYQDVLVRHPHPQLKCIQLSHILHHSITITAQYSQYYDIIRYDRKALWRLREKKIQRITAAAVALAWQRSGGGDAATAVAARQQRRRQRGGRGGSG
jgi:hypothetical protein